MAMATSARIPTVSWDEFLDMFDWKQGEHVTLIGPTGCGKTTLTNRLLPLRRYVIFLGSKRKDETQEKLLKQGFHLANDPAMIHSDISTAWVVRPSFPKKATAAQLRALHASTFRETLMRAYRDGSWTVVIDEGRYVTDYLGLKDEAVLLWQQGRSQGNSILMGTQRPRYVPLEAYDQATHLFFWKDPDNQNVKRAAELAGVNRNEVAKAVESLDWHEVLYANTRNGEMVITKVDI